jgi:hypothetical protein
VFSGDDLEVTSGGELVVLGTKADGRVRARIVTLGVPGGSDVFFGNVYSPGIDLEIDGDVLVVLAARADGKVWVKSVDPSGGSVVYQQRSGASGLDVELTGGGDYIVMGVQHSDGAIRIRVNETDGSGGFHQYTIN